VAQKVQVVLTDDLDGTEAEETLVFAWEGNQYEIDLSEKNADKFRKAVAPYLGAARRVGRASANGRKPAARPAPPAAERTDLSDVRAWARDNGFQVSDRGRVSGEIKAAFEAAR
jgi:hypothetical protein